MTQQKMDDHTAALVLGRLIEHLQKRTDVQNIDLMNLAGFCRNCLSNWYQEELTKQGKSISVADAKKLIYGMDYDQWKKQHQVPATPDQLKKMADNKNHQH